MMRDSDVVCIDGFATTCLTDNEQPSTILAFTAGPQRRDGSLALVLAACSEGGYVTCLK